eukprot:488562_1
MNREALWMNLNLRFILNEEKIDGVNTGVDLERFNSEQLYDPPQPCAPQKVTRTPRDDEMNNNHSNHIRNLTPKRYDYEPEFDIYDPHKEGSAASADVESVDHMKNLPKIPQKATTRTPRDNEMGYQIIENILKQCDGDEWETYLNIFKSHKINDHRLKHLPLD